MAKKLEYPNGYVGVVSDKVAEILKSRPGHKIVGEAVEPKKPVEGEKEKK